MRRLLPFHSISWHGHQLLSSCLLSHLLLVLYFFIHYVFLFCLYFQFSSSSNTFIPGLQNLATLSPTTKFTARNRDIRGSPQSAPYSPPETMTSWHSHLSIVAGRMYVSTRTVDVTMAGKNVSLIRCFHQRVGLRPWNSSDALPDSRALAVQL